MCVFGNMYQQCHHPGCSVILHIHTENIRVITEFSSKQTLQSNSLLQINTQKQMIQPVLTNNILSENDYFGRKMNINIQKANSQLNNIMSQQQIIIKKLCQLIQLQNPTKYEVGVVKQN